MRSLKHWTPTYVKDRLAEMWYQKTNPDKPWLTRDANLILDSYLKKSDHGLEFGSGRSSLWLAQRVAKLTSVEHNEAWYQRVKQMIAEHSTENIDYRYLAQAADEKDAPRSGYVRVADEFAPASLDFVLVDGIYRDHVAESVIDKLRPGGVLIIDNVNRYLPSDTRSPASRSLQAGPDGPVWEKVYREIESWRRIWTTSGVTDTAFFFKPC